MNRFKTSKYRNARVKPAKRENWYLDINIGNLKLSCSNHIKASSHQMAFNMETGGGGSLGIMNLKDFGRRDKAPPHLHCHADFVTDMDFSPFDDESLFATCSYDCSIKLWKLPDSASDDNLPSSAISVLPVQPTRVDLVNFHPTASEVLSSSCGKTVTIWDLEKCQQKFELSDHSDVIQSFSWKGDGSLLATSCKDKKIRVFDPRTATCAGEGNGFGGMKDSRVLWLGDRNHILGSGFSLSRERQVIIWDINNLNTPLETISIDNNTGTLMPFYDPDTDMLLLAGKGDSSILYFEVKEGGNPYLHQVSAEMMESQSKGMALVPKRAMDVMSCEVMRLLQLTSRAIVPVSYSVPRKNMTDYQEDLYPDTFGNTPAMTCQEWCSGLNKSRERVSLNPSKKTALKSDPKPQHKTEQQQKSTGLKDVKQVEKLTSLPKPSNTVDVKQDVQPSPPAAQKTASPVKKIFSNIKTSKFRHIEGVPMHKSNNIENIRNLSLSTFGECDGLQVNSEFLAWLVAGPGGQILVHQLSKAGRLPDTGVPVIQCGTTVMDFVFDPFNNHRIAAACESGNITIWDIPKGGLADIIDEPSTKLRGHYDKPTIVRYHPTASNVLASASADLTVKIWDIETEKCVITIQDHQEQPFSLSWSLDGKQLATISKDKKIRVYEPRTSTKCKQIGQGPEGSRGARIFWAGPKSELIVVSGFDRASMRCLSVYNANDVSEPVESVQLESAPSILIPYYDDDTGVVMLSGKGDTAIFGFEVSPEPPYIYELTHYRSSDPFQAVGFLSKNCLDVRTVEIARGVKLSTTNIEIIQFKVPRVKMEYFQDDIFPDTKVKWETALTSKEWFGGKNKELKKISLKPADMKALSEAPKEAPVAKKYDSTRELEEYKSDEQKKEMLVAAMVEKLGTYDEDPLPQDMMEGVDDDEWDD